MHDSIDYCIKIILKKGKGKEKKLMTEVWWVSGIELDRVRKQDGSKHNILIVVLARLVSF